MKRIVINADDFGINSIVTRAIEDMIAQGIVTSTTIMANGACLKEVKEIYDKYPNVSYGIHLCIAEFDSITKSTVLHKYGLTNSEGVFFKQGLWEIKSFPNELKQALYEELCAQIELVQSYGINLSHADSHQLVHTSFIELQDIFMEALKKHNIGRIRIGEEVRPVRILLNNIKTKFTANTNTDTGVRSTNVINEHKESSRGIIKRFVDLLLVWKKSCKINKEFKTSFKTVDYFYSVRDFLHSKPRNGNFTYELMCHPGHPALVYTTEMQELMDSKLFSDSGIQLISYNML